MEIKKQEKNYQKIESLIDFFEDSTGFYSLPKKHKKTVKKLKPTAKDMYFHIMEHFTSNNFSYDLFTTNQLSRELETTAKNSIVEGFNELHEKGLFLIADCGLKGRMIFLNVTRNLEKYNSLISLNISKKDISTYPNMKHIQIEDVSKLKTSTYPNKICQHIQIEDVNISKLKTSDIPITQDITSFDIAPIDPNIDPYISNTENKSIVSSNINPKTDDKIQAEISNVSLEKENKLDEKFILDSTKEIIHNQEINQAEKKEVAKNTFNQNKTFQQFKSSQNSINQNRTAQDKELEEKIIKRLKDIGLTQVELIIKNYSLQHIRKHLAYFQYSEEQKPYILFNSIKNDLAPPPEYLRQKRLKKLEPLFDRWQPVLREYRIPASGLAHLDDALIEMSYKIIDKIDDIQDCKSSLIDTKEQKGSLYNSAIKFFKNILSKLDYNEILEIFKEYVSNKDYRVLHYKLRYFTDDQVKKYLNSVNQIKNYSELPEH